MTAEPHTAAAADTSTADPAIAALTFDDAFAELRAVVAELEAGGLALEETIARTERAVALQRHCEKLLGAAELRVRQLINRPGGGLEARDIAADEASDA
ncbi:MAG: exodeoxyribonuclease VII small subunit [Chloroflexota bacterium]|nr:exodeoxyribonuclease VII small subunit [Chloroflexota bacterium]